MKVGSSETLFFVDQTARCHMPENEKLAINNRFIHR